MKTAKASDLRNRFATIAAWIEDGESVTILRRGKAFATLTPVSGAQPWVMPKIDFEGRLKEIWGDRIFSDVEISTMRAAELEGEEG